MKKIIIFWTVLILISIKALMAQTPVFMDFDTVAIQGMPLQPVMKIYINDPVGNLSLKRLDIKSYCEDFADVDSVFIYRSTYNRFSLADYTYESQNDAEEITSIPVAFSPTDSIASFNGLTYPLQTGDNYIWVFLKLTKNSKPGHSLKVAIPALGMTINSSNYPANESFSNSIPIRALYFQENFSSYGPSEKPLNWQTERIDTFRTYVGDGWLIKDGGFGQPDNFMFRNPHEAKSGDFNARLVHPYDDIPYIVRLNSKVINLSLATKPTLTFYHAQSEWVKIDQTSHYDTLGVYYKIGSNSTWKSLASYTLPTPNTEWVKREIVLPDDAINDNFYLSFMGTAKWGFGVCVDSIMVFENASEPRNINSIIAVNPNTNAAPQSSTNNPLMRFNVRIKGNSGDVSLNSITFTSENSNDNDVALSGAKLFYTTDSVFNLPKQIGTVQSFSGGKITFTGLNKKIETGNNYFWLTYDVASTATPDNLLDASIKAGDMSFSGLTGTWPQTDLSPIGNLIVEQSVFFDDFETDKSWIFTGEFERNAPMGKGGLQLGGDSRGNADPTSAYSNSNIIGTDLTVDGNYSNNISKATADAATSPMIYAEFFKNTRLNFYRWLNIESQDSANVEYKYEGDSKWRYLWGNKKYEFQESNWKLQEFDTKKIFDRKNFQLRFIIDSTSVINRFTGWNVDYLFVTGDSIKFDAAITKFISPNSSCKLGSDEHLKVTVKNTGPKLLTSIPIKASIDGGKTWITETIPGTLSINDSIDYQFTTASNFSKAAIYSVIVKVTYPQDNFTDNDSVALKITSIPTYTIPYTNGFEKDTTFWIANGINSSWAQRKPGGSNIKDPFEGQKCWKTDFSGTYVVNEYSAVESPCFDFSGTDKPIIQFQNSFKTQFKEDGARLEYSINEGASWNYVTGDTTQFSWKWYNDTISLFSNLRGWTGLTGSAFQPWQQVRHYLSEVANKDNVKFRIVFKTSTPKVTVPQDGFAFDLFHLQNAPYDAGVQSIDNLGLTACENSNPTKLQLKVKNFGIRKINQNDSIIVGIKVNNKPIIKDTFKLASDLEIGATSTFTMTKPADIVAPGNYAIKAYVIEKDAAFYGTNNDTLTFNFTVYPNPLTNLPDTIYTAQKDTLVIKTLTDPNYQYSWKFGGSEVSDSSKVAVFTTDFGKHHLDVVNSVSFCSTRDSVFVKQLIPDIGIESILSPESNCGYKTATSPSIRIHNFGTDTMRVNQKIPIMIKLNSNAIIKDTVSLMTKFDPKTSFDVTLSSTTLNLLTPRKDTLKIYTTLSTDLINTNDTTTKIFDIYGYPTVYLGKDTTVKGILTYDLDAGAGYNTYAWSDGTTTSQKCTINKPGTYAVTITDANGCDASDTIKVHMVIHDLSMQKLVSPVDACGQTATTTIQCQLKNTGTDTIQTFEPLILSYEINGGPAQKDTIYPLVMIKPNDSIQYTFKEKTDMVLTGPYSFKLRLICPGDIQPLNDTLMQSVEVFGYPTVDMGANRIVQGLNYNLYPGKFAQYQWQDNSADSSWMITKTKFQTNNTYSVTVTDEHGCTDKDTVIIYLIINDLEVTDLLLPRSICASSDNELVNVKITNTGNEILTNKAVELSYSLNEAPEVMENINFTGGVGATMVHTFVLPLDLSNKGDYKFKVKLKMAADVQPLNDTATFLTRILGYPQVTLGAPNDTLLVKLPYTIQATPGYSEYLWQDNSTASSFTVTKANYQATNDKYDVIVYDDNGCSVSKFVHVIEAIYDLGVTGINVPLTNCTIPSTGRLSVQFKNNSTMNMLNQDATLSYTVDGGTAVSKPINITLTKGSSQTIDFSDNIDLSEVGTHNIAVSLNYADDENIADNTVTYPVQVFGNPTISFGGAGDTIKTNSFPISINAGEGFKTYLWGDNSTSQNLSAGAEGLYKVSVTDNNNCPGNDSIYVKFETGIKELKDLESLSIYPNPASDYIYIEIKLAKKQNLVMDMISQEGKVVYRTKLSNMELYREDIDVSVLPKGMYFVRIYTKDSMVIRKIVVR